MIKEESVHTKETPFFIEKIKDYAQIMKPKVSFMVAFSSILGYLLVPGTLFSWGPMMALFLGGILVTLGAHSINQMIERYSDRFMERTKNRPLPNGRVGLFEGIVLAISSTFVGLFILYQEFNLVAAGVSLVSLLIYGFIYTPIKKIHPIATFIGAIPGALPPLIGWVAATGSLDPAVAMGGFILFGIQFFWQFPHVWSIAWLHYDEYSKAGILMLPSRSGRTRFTGLQCIYYSLAMVPFVLIPHQMKLSGEVGMWIAFAAVCVYAFFSYRFFKNNDKKSAKNLLITSLVVLPVILLALVIDKI